MAGGNIWVWGGYGTPWQYNAQAVCFTEITCHDYYFTSCITALYKLCYYVNVSLYLSTVQ